MNQLDKTKTCRKCGETKSLDAFGKHKTHKDGLESHCKLCQKAQKKAYREANKEKIKAFQKAYQKANKEKISAQRKAHYEANKERLLAQKKAYHEANKEKLSAKNKAYYAANREKLLAQAKACQEANKEKLKAQKKAYREANKEKIKAYKKANKEKISAQRKAHYEANKERLNARIRQRRKNDVQFRLRLNLRGRLNQAIKNQQKTGSAVRDLGCTIKELMRHLEAQFTEGMSWENWALDGWHIDHIKPLASFDLTDRKQLLEACHYTNLQPLWAKDNFSKGAAIINQIVTP